MPPKNPKGAYRTLMQGLRLPINNWDRLRQYERRFNALEPYLSQQEIFDAMNQFSRHEAYLSQRTGTGPRPTQEQLEDLRKRQNRSKSSRDEAPFDAPEGAGRVTAKRKAEEADLTFDEEIDYLLGDYFDPPSPPGGPPPPPPPSGGAVFI